MPDNLLVRARRAFLPLHGVVGVGYGAKLTRGKLVTPHAIIVLVERKLAREQIREGEHIPSTFDGVATDVRVPRLMPTDDGPRDRCLTADYQWLDFGKIHQMSRQQRGPR